MITFDSIFNMQPVGQDYLDIFKNDSEIGSNNKEIINNNRIVAESV
jgi:hypothetical protein